MNIFFSDGAKISIKWTNREIMDKNLRATAEIIKDIFDIVKPKKLEINAHTATRLKNGVSSLSSENEKTICNNIDNVIADLTLLKRELLLNSEIKKKL